MDAADLARLVRAALDEDLGRGDATTDATVGPDVRGSGVLLARESLILAGTEPARIAFRLLDDEIGWQDEISEGQRVLPGQIFARVDGRARALLSAERLALNFLQRLSGVATMTRRFADAVAGTGARIRDTRKTTPLLRALEKDAVVVGGGTPHRMRLDDAILVKDNHVRLAGGVAAATRLALAAAEGRMVEIEVDRLDQIEPALAAGAQMILVDNFEPPLVREAVKLIAGRVPIEASGGIGLANVRAYAEAGVDFIAIGALTHSAPAVDISFEIEPA